MCPTVFISAWPCPLLLQQDTAVCVGSLVPLLYPSTASLLKMQTFSCSSGACCFLDILLPALWHWQFGSFCSKHISFCNYSIRTVSGELYKWFFECLFGGFACVRCCFGLLLSSFSLRNNRLHIYSLGFNNHHGNYQKPQLYNVTHLHLLSERCLPSFIMEMALVS